MPMFALAHFLIYFFVGFILKLTHLEEWQVIGLLVGFVVLDTFKTIVMYWEK